MIDRLDLEDSRCVDGVDVLYRCCDDVLLLLGYIVEWKNRGWGRRVEKAGGWRRWWWKRVGDVGRLSEELL